MTRKSILSPSTPAVNGQPPGDAVEPASVSDAALNFDPAELEAGGSAAAPAGPDPFDVASLRLTQDFGAGLGVKKALLTVPVRKPDKSWFVRVHPDETYRLQTALIELKEDRESYLVARPLWDGLATEATFKPKLLVTAVNRQGVVFLWEANLPRPDGRKDEWTRSALEAIQRATTRWVRLAANMSLGAYDLYEASASLDDPEWPALSFGELLGIAFKDRYIDKLDHPVLRRLRGEV